MKNKPRGVSIGQAYAVWPSGEYCELELLNNFKPLSRSKPVVVYADTPKSALLKFMPEHKAIQFIRETR